MQLRTHLPHDPFTRVRDVTVEGTRLEGRVGKAAVPSFVYFRDNVHTPTCHQLDSPPNHSLCAEAPPAETPLCSLCNWTPAVSSVSSPLVLRMGLSLRCLCYQLQRAWNIPGAAFDPADLNDMNQP